MRTVGQIPRTRFALGDAIAHEHERIALPKESEKVIVE